MMMGKCVCRSLGVPVEDLHLMKDLHLKDLPRMSGFPGMAVAVKILRTSEIENDI